MKNISGKIINRYNIVKAQLEYYLIPSLKQKEYEQAIFSQDLNAHKKYGIQMNFTSK